MQRRCTRVAQAVRSHVSAPLPFAPPILDLLRTWSPRARAAATEAVLAFCGDGIWSAYITQGVLQETLSTKRFGPEARRFDHLVFLNFAQNVVCFVWSFIMIKLWSSGTSSTGRAPLWKYWGVSITNTVGPTMGIEALKYVSYPAQVLAKSSKMIPGFRMR